MKVIRKYKLENINASNILELPKFSTLLSIGIENDDIMLYAMVDESKELENNWVFIIGNDVQITDELAPSLVYFATIKDNNGTVWHAFHRSTLYDTVRKFF